MHLLTKSLKLAERLSGRLGTPDVEMDIIEVASEVLELLSELFKPK